MKLLIKIALLLLFPVIAIAQDSLITISPSMFDKTSDQLYLDATEGWLFREGSDTAWAKKDINTTGWKKLSPIEISAKYADKNGKVDCWFRIKIKLDTAFGNEAFGFKSASWAASDFYIDGNLIASHGNTGNNGTPFHEFSPYGHLSLPVNLKPGNEYTIALHFVDYISPLPPLRLKSQDVGLLSLLRITGPDYNAFFLLNNIKEPSIYDTIWLSVCTVLTLLFWLLSIQNPFEKNLRLIALCSSFLTLTLFSTISASNTNGISYSVYLLYKFSVNVFLALTCITMPLILVTIFKRELSSALKIFLVIFFICQIINFFLPDSISNLVASGLLGVLFAVCMYYIVSSWKKLKGAQWAIVVGLLLSLSWGLVYVFMVLLSNSQNVFLFYLSITGYALSLPLSLMVYISMRFKEIINEVRQNSKQVVQLSEEKKEQALNQQKMLEEEVSRQTTELRNTLDNLKSTQSQLIQSEKMASLGELTAGIAHEIQNPLNFVNNFSEVNTELITEMKEEIDKGNISEVKAIANDISDNEQKINHHGKRADAIVKGMLQHSRSSSGVKEPTDINALADEYLRLAYHGLRAKDKSFNAIMKTDFDEHLDKIKVVPQDIGRVILNLFTNAFYSVSEKKKSLSAEALTKEGAYEPTVSVSTKQSGNKIEIRVKDNGMGVPRKVIDKIFQPFFTTKPVGQGTGLGLSLSYDIIKAHGGDLKVETKEGEGAEFIINLPV